VAVDTRPGAGTHVSAPQDGLLMGGHIYPLVFQRVGDEWLLTMLGNNELIDDI
jgi:hypothetical protein